jgi:Bacterial Ig-like domain (group 3)/FG-GAP-like repeat
VVSDESNVSRYSKVPHSCLVKGQRISCNFSGNGRTILKRLLERERVLRQTDDGRPGGFLRSLLCRFATVIACSSSVVIAAPLKYQPLITISTGSTVANQFAVGDFNGDGKPDFAFADQNGSTVSAYLNQGGGKFSAPVVTQIGGSFLGAILAGDFNQDGKTDLVLSLDAAHQAQVLLSNGDGTFAPQTPIPNATLFVSGKVADFNGDGHPDLLLGGNGEPYLFLGKGDGTFTQVSIPNGSFPGAYSGEAVDDFNGDKLLDAVLADSSDPGSQAGSIDYYPGAAGGTFATPNFLTPAAIPNPESLDSADFNNDGKLDLLIAGSSGSFVSFGNGDGSFQLGSTQLIPLAIPPFFSPSVSNPDFFSALASDLDQDGKPDAVVIDSTSGALSLYVNDGTGTFPNAATTPYAFQLPAKSNNIAAADFNGDGLPDILVSTPGASTLTLLLSVKNLATPVLSLTSANNTVLVGTALALTATANGGSTVPSGTVSLLDGGTQISQQALGSSGTAVFDLPGLSTGVHTLTFSYSGDTNFVAATSPALSQSVTDFQATITPGTQTVMAGSAATYSLNVTPEAGFSGTLALTCSGLPNLTTCNASSLNVAAAPASATITVNTTAATSAIAGRVDYHPLYPWALLSCLVFWRFRRNHRFTASAASRLALFGVVLISSGLAGCGSGSKAVAPVTPTNPVAPVTPGTSAGTSTITITATVTQNGTILTHTAMATLTVQ